MFLPADPAAFAWLWRSPKIPKTHGFFTTKKHGHSFGASGEKNIFSDPPFPMYKHLCILYVYTYIFGINFHGKTHVDMNITIHIISWIFYGSVPFPPRIFVVWRPCGNNNPQSSWGSWPQSFGDFFFMTGARFKKKKHGKKTRAFFLGTSTKKIFCWIPCIFWWIRGTFYLKFGILIHYTFIHNVAGDGWNPPWINQPVVFLFVGFLYILVGA